VPLVHLPAATRPPQPWRNGGGVTFEIARAPAPAGSPREFLWRVSMARVDRPGPFSSFAGFTRLIAVVSGAGMRLRGIGATDVDLHPFRVVRFDGALAVEGLLPHGTVDDFNVMYDADACGATLEILAEERVEQKPGDSELLVVNLAPTPLTWTSAAERGTLGERDALRLQPPHAGIALRDAARVALVEIRAGANRHT
jgi:uncharacterized protein